MKHLLVACGLLLSALHYGACHAERGPGSASNVPYHELTAGAYCDGAGVVHFGWQFNEDPKYPVGHPEWTGWDVYRISTENCVRVRVNAEPYPRLPGSHGHTYTETPPNQVTRYEYQAITVDDNRQPVDAIQCVGCYNMSWASCSSSTPLTMGTVDDYGWAMSVIPCAETCFPWFYFEGPVVEEIRQYPAGTVFNFWGYAYCGTVEGCGMHVERYEVTKCGVTAVAPSTWGRIKTTYR